MVHPPATPVGETHGITVSRHAEFSFDTFKLPRDHHIPQPEQRHRSEANFTGLMLFGQGNAIWSGYMATLSDATFGCLDAPHWRLTCVI